MTARALSRLVEVCHRYPWPVLSLALPLAALSLWLTAEKLVLEPDRGALLSEDEYHRKQLDYNREFPDPDDMLVVVEGGTAKDRERFVDELAATLTRSPEHFQRVFPLVELPFLKDRVLYFLDLESLESLADSLEEARPLLEALSTTRGLPELLGNLNTKMAREDSLAAILPFLNQVVEQLLTSLETRGRFEYQSPWGALFFGDAESEGAPAATPELRDPGQTVFYNTLANGKIHLLLVQAVPDSPGNPIELLREELSKAETKHRHVEASLTGEPVLEYDELVSSRMDSTKSAWLSLILVALLFAYGFRELLRPMAGLLALSVGIAWTLGFATLAIGHLNLLTMSFAALLIGLGIDFGIHLAYRYDEELARDLPPLKAMQNTMTGTGVEIFTGAVSTSVAFWAVGLTDFKGVSELGIIAGTGVSLCFLSMVTVLPSVLFLAERENPRVGLRGNLPDWMKRWEKRLQRRAGWVVALALAALLISLTKVGDVRFDYNLLRMQAQSLESVQAELRLIQSNDRTVLSGAVLAGDLTEARALSSRLQTLPTVSRVESVCDLIPEDFNAKSSAILRIEAILEDIEPPSLPPARKSENLKDMADGFLELEKAFRKAYPSLTRSENQEIRTEARAFNRNLDLLFGRLESMGPGPIEDGMSAFQQSFFSDLRELVLFLKGQRTSRPLTLADLPTDLIDRGVGETGKILLRVYPRRNVWEREPLENFVKDLRSVDKDALGSPVMMLHHTNQLKRAFEVSGLYAFIAICLILLIHFRSLKKAALALLPLLLGVCWMLGLMAERQVDFNLANFMALPLLLGVGLDFGIHVVHRIQEEGATSLFSNSTGPATLLSGLTTMAGFSSLMGASHYGIASLGFVLTTGMLSMLVASLVVLPAVMRLLGGGSPTEGTPEELVGTDLRHISPNRLPLE